MSMRLTEFTDCRVWNLSGFTVDQICFDYRTIFLIAEASSLLTVTIESPFTFQLDTQVETVEQHSPSSRIAVLSLLHESVES